MQGRETAGIFGGRVPQQPVKAGDLNTEHTAAPRVLWTACGAPLACLLVHVNVRDRVVTVCMCACLSAGGGPENFPLLNTLCFRKCCLLGNTSR